MIVTVQDPRLLAWAQKQLGVSFQAGSYTIARIAEDGEILCVVVYTNWHRTGCEMAIASTSPRWASAGFIRACMHYPFKQLNLTRISMVTAETNKRCLGLIRRLGASQEGRLRRWYAGGVDALVHGLFEDELPEWVFGPKHSLPAGIPTGPLGFHQRKENGTRRFPERATGA
jgi:RimJ/RimL family protein N-acetyltransferase